MTQKFRHIKPAIDELIRINEQSPIPLSACFDLDNTLLLGDIGDAALAYMIDNAAVKNLRWSDYLRLIEQGELAKAYETASKAFSGMEVGCVRRMANILLDERKESITIIESDKIFKIPLPKINPLMLEIVNLLQQNKFDIYIISASNQYLVEEAAARFNIPAENCFGLRNKIKMMNGVTILEKRILKPIHVGEGKVKTFNKIFKNHRPIISGGDSIVSDITFLSMTNIPGLIFWLGEPVKNNQKLQDLSKTHTLIEMNHLFSAR